MDEDSRALLEFLSQYVSEGKKEAMEKVLDSRTRHLTIVLEDIYQPQNASAVVRSCDCFGVQDLHVIENENDYTLNPRVVHGASKWVDIISYNEGDHNSSDCFTRLKLDGYRLIGMVCEPEARSIYELPVDNPVALVFGTEKDGISAVAREYCDELITIPMYGFTESFNISVSAALAMSILSQKIFNSELPWHLSEQERQELKLRWSRKVVHRSDILEKEFLKSRKHF